MSQGTGPSQLVGLSIPISRADRALLKWWANEVRHSNVSKLARAYSLDQLLAWARADRDSGRFVVPPNVLVRTDVHGGDHAA